MKKVVAECIVSAVRTNKMKEKLLADLRKMKVENLAVSASKHEVKPDVNKPVMKQSCKQ